MELIRINDSKLKIMLTSLDMKNYALDAQTLTCGTEETRRAFRSILHDAGICSDTEEGADKIYVQYYPSREGGCEMFVTRLAALESENDQSSTKERYRPSTAVRCGKAKAASLPLAYRFDTLSLLLNACRQLRPAITDAHKKIPSHAYRDDSGCFYLTVDTTLEEQASATLALLLGEFGTACQSKRLSVYITEHATVLCRSHAVEVLGEL